MHFQHLADVHPRRNAQRVEHDVDRLAVRHVRHVFDRNDARDDALVPVAARHLVARLQAALDGDIDLDHLLHARRQFVALCEFLALFVEGDVEVLARLLQALAQGFELLRHVLVGHADVEPVARINSVEVSAGHRGALGEAFRTAVGALAQDQAFDAREGVALDDAELVGEIELVRAQMLVDDRLRALVALDAFAGEYLHVDDRAGDARRNAQGSVLHVGSLLAEDRAQQLFLGSELGFALGRHLADQHVAGVDLGADIDDARLVEPRQLRLAHRRDVSGDFLRPQLGVARDDGQFLDVDRGEAVFGDDSFRNQDRVLEVVAVPGHERDQHVLAEREFPLVGRRAVGDHVALGDDVADAHQRPLVDVGVLIRAGVFHQVVDVDAHFARHRLLVVDPHHDARGVDVVDLAAAQGPHRGARVDGHRAFDAGAHDGFLRP